MIDYESQSVNISFEGVDEDEGKFELNYIDLVINYTHKNDPPLVDNRKSNKNNISQQTTTETTSGSTPETPSLPSFKLPDLNLPPVSIPGKSFL